VQQESEEEASGRQSDIKEAQGVDVERVASRLMGIPATSKSALFRQLMPVIEARLAVGVSHQAILEALKAEGIAVSAATFKSYLSRFRTRNVHLDSSGGPSAAVEAAEAQPARASQTPAAGRLTPPAAPAQSIANKGDLARARSEPFDLNKLAEFGKSKRRNEE
jgi:hypothetical protein